MSREIRLATDFGTVIVTVPDEVVETSGLDGVNRLWTTGGAVLAYVREHLELSA